MNHVVEGDPDAPALLPAPAQDESRWGCEDAIGLLSSEFRVFAIDLRGQGRYNLNTRGADVERFVDLVVQRPTIVAGNSSGGVITAYVAAYGRPGLAQTPGPIFALWAKWLGPQWSIGDWAGMVDAAPRELPAFPHPGIGFMTGEGIPKVAPPAILDDMSPRTPCSSCSTAWEPPRSWSSAASTPRCTGCSPTAGWPSRAPWPATSSPLDMAAIPVQHLREHGPERAQAWVTGAANAGCDHASMLAQVRTPVLLTRHFHMTDPGTGRLMGAMTDIRAAQARRLRWHSSTRTSSRSAQDPALTWPGTRARVVRPRAALSGSRPRPGCAGRRCPRSRPRPRPRGGSARHLRACPS